MKYLLMLFKDEVGSGFRVGFWDFWLYLVGLGGVDDLLGTRYLLILFCLGVGSGLGGGGIGRGGKLL